MLDRFSVAANRSIDLAGDEARRLKHPYIGTEHLLLGVLAEGHSPAAQMLRRAGAPLKACREKVAEALARRDLPPPPRPDSPFDLTDRAARALDRASKLSLRMKSEEVDAVHVLLSVLDVEGTAGQVLRGLNVDIGSLRDDLTRAATGDDETVDGGRAPSPPPAAAVALPDEEPVPPAAPEPAHVPAEPVCAACGAPLRSSLAHAVVESPAGGSYDVVFCSACGAAFGATRSSPGS